MFLSRGMRNITKRACSAAPFAAGAGSFAQTVPAGERRMTAFFAWPRRSVSSCFFEAPGGNGWPIVLTSRLCVLESKAYHCSGVEPS
jgi:hypothetical protein